MRHFSLSLSFSVYPSLCPASFWQLLAMRHFSLSLSFLTDPHRECVERPHESKRPSHPN